MDSPTIGQVKALLSDGMALCAQSSGMFQEAIQAIGSAYAEAAGATTGSANPTAHAAIPPFSVASSHGDNATALLAAAARAADEYRAGI